MTPEEKTILHELEESKKIMIFALKQITTVLLGMTLLLENKEHISIISDCIKMAQMILANEKE